MTGHKIRIKGFDQDRKTGKFVKKTRGFRATIAQRKAARNAVRVLRKGKPLI